MDMGLPPWPVIIPWSLESVGEPLAAQNNAVANLASAAYPVANLAIYIPFVLGRRVDVRKLVAQNGATVSGNIDVGIYDAGTAGPSNRIISAGSTAQTGANILQQFDIADTLVGPGLFYMAVALSNTTGTFYRTATPAEVLRSIGLFQQTSAFPLPATATPATMAQAYIPLFGLVQGRTVV